MGRSSRGSSRPHRCEGSGPFGGCAGRARTCRTPTGSHAPRGRRTCGPRQGRRRPCERPRTARRAFASRPRRRASTCSRARTRTYAHRSEEATSNGLALASLSDPPRTILRMKRCAACGSEKPRSSFSSNRAHRDGLQTYCIDCSRVYQRRHYQKNAQKYRARAVARNARRRAVVRRIFQEAKAQPCSDCGRSYPPFVMDFDHVDPGSKRFTIGRDGWHNRTLIDIRREIAKCDVVCANCHRIRTHTRRRSLGRQDSNLD